MSPKSILYQRIAGKRSEIGSHMAKANPVVIPRDLRLDLYRGGALWLIFLAHIPGTIINQIAPWKYGFSDPAEIFIFVSGYANAYVYGRVMGQRGFLAASAQIERRAFETYVAQYPGLEDRLLNLNYAGRLGTPEEIGQAAVYLLSDETRFLSGHDLVIDGARTVAT